MLKSCFVFGLVLLAAISMSASYGPLSTHQLQSLREHEAQVWPSAAPQATFEVLKQDAVASDCENAPAPEAIATPNPLLNHSDSRNRITLSFIVGTDGRVYSPLILQNSDESEDATLIDAVNHWRYRPAMCDGAPVESEGKVEFSYR